MSGGLDQLAVGEGFAWVLDTTLDTLTPVGETDGTVRPAIDLGSDAEDVAVGFGSVWIAAGGDVLELNPATLQVVRTIEVGDTPIVRLAVDVEAGTLWLDFAASV